MKTKLSDMVSKIESKYRQTTGTLYEPSGEPTKPCKVCALGGIALIGAPTKFKIYSDNLGGLCEADNEGEYIGTGEYKKILRAAGVPDDKITSQTPYYARVQNEYGKIRTIETINLDDFIYHLNDYGADFDLIAWTLKEYGL